MVKYNVLHPKYWPLWFVLAIFWCIAQLPRSWQPKIGRCLGRLLFLASKKLRHVISSNISACFPELSDSDREAAVQLSSQELGISLIETFWVWFRNTDNTLVDRFVIEGQGYVDQALAEGRGVIVLACHHGAVDVNGALLSKVPRGDKQLVGTFRQTDEVINRILHKLRSPFSDKMISAGDQRGMVRVLRKGGLVWYAPDIEVKNKASAFIDFMGVKASTTLAVSRLAKATNSVVIPFGHYRENDKLEYRAVFYPPLSSFPSDNLEHDARAVNAAIETIIEPHPYRYWWAIKRFKNRPQGEPPIY